MQPGIWASNISKRFDGFEAVSGLNITVPGGEVYGLLGPDGAGKTTTMRLLCGAYSPNTGEISIAGIDMIKQREQARSELGYLPQRFSLYEDLTVIENLRFFAEVRGLAATAWRPRSMEILQFVGLDEFLNRKAGQLSGGMKQKLGLAAALVHRPRVLLLDEPTTGVDPVTRQDFWQLIIRLVSTEAVAVLVSTPYMDEAASCRRVGFMQSGRLLVEDTPDNLRLRLAGQLLELRGQPLARLRRAAEADEHVQDVQMFGDRLHIRVPADRVDGVIKRLQERISAEGWQVTQLRPVPAQLEDVFIALLENNSENPA